MAAGLSVVLVAAACGDATSPQAAAATSTSTSTTVTTPPTTTIPPTTTTSPPRFLKPPGRPDSFRASIVLRSSISAPGAADVNLAVIVEADVLPLSRRVTSVTRFGDLTFEDIEMVDIEGDTYIREKGKPWRETDDWINEDLMLDVIAPRSAGRDLRRLYEILDDSDWIPETTAGVETRRYTLEGEHGRTALWAFDVMEIGDIDLVDPTISATVWMDASSGRIVAMDARFTGPVEMVGQGLEDWPPDARADAQIEFELTDVDDGTIIVTAPDVPEIDAPDGYLLFESRDYGLSFAYPEDWTFTEAGIPGWAPGVSFITQIIDWNSGSSLTVVAEDLGGTFGMTLDEYIEISLLNYEAAGSLTVTDREAVTLSGGQPAQWITVSDVTGAGGIVLTQLFTISGTDALIWSIAFETAAFDEEVLGTIYDTIRFGSGANGDDTA